MSGYRDVSCDVQNGFEYFPALGGIAIADGIGNSNFIGFEFD